jgi:hypothetical protein
MRYLREYSNAIVVLERGPHLVEHLRLVDLGHDLVGALEHLARDILKAYLEFGIGQNGRDREFMVRHKQHVTDVALDTKERTASVDRVAID